MPQSPFQTDQLQIEPGSGDTLIIGRDSTTGGISFQDAVITSSITLKDLAGISTISGLYVVGAAGTGAQYTTIQSALDGVPATSSSSDSNLILVFPGSYNENLNVQKDGVVILGLGLVRITPLAASPTMTVQAGVGSTPKFFKASNLIISNPNVGGECVFVSGGVASEVGQEKVLFDGCTFEASGNGAFQLKASTVNRVEISGGSFAGSASNSLIEVTQVANFKLSGVEDANHVQISYNTAGSIPVELGSVNKITSVTSAGDLLCDFQGAGGLDLKASDFNSVTQSGDQSSEAVNCDLGDVILNDTTSVVSVSSRRGSLAGSPTSIFSESSFQGVLSFAASSTESFTFPVAQPDSNYFVSLEASVGPPLVTVKTPTSFTVFFSGGPQTTDVNFKVTRS